MKLFISYARVDKPLCKQVVAELEDVHEVWYDKRLHAGQDWWDEIQERLGWCEGFVYLLSPESVKSEYCQKEYAIAASAGKHIFPVLIQARTQIPAELSHIQYADLSEGMEDIITLIKALSVAEIRGLKRPTAPSPKPQPTQPAQPPKNVTPNAALTQAADALEAENYDHAVYTIKQALEKKPTGRIQRLLQSLLTEAESALERQAYLREAEREYAHVRVLVQREATRGLGCDEFGEFRKDFPDYDPDDIETTCADFSTPLPAQRSGEGPGVRAILPAPFAWIDIPAGRGTMKTDESGVTLQIPTQGYSISKYPVTNAQFAKFIEAGGYNTERWWTQQGWQQRQSSSWTQPRFWDNSKWNGAEQPVVGVSWYEAVAFCLWLSEITGESVMLPTEEQWQYAAQGDDNRVYPWGNEWENWRCNNRVFGLGGFLKAKPNGHGKHTTPVTAYEGKGDSQFGVVDMSGNVWEWCLTDYDDRTNDVNSNANMRVLRGGSWNNLSTDNFRAADRYGNLPGLRGFNNGFRCVRSS